MKIPFRQGILSAPPGFLLVGSESVSLRFSQYDSVVVTMSDSGNDPATQFNYVFAETVSVDDAWTGLTAGQTCWLYWDFDLTTGARTFGHTLVEPVAQPTPPLSPPSDQHWFNTVSSTMYVWSSVAQRWLRKIRVFACELRDGGNPISMSINATDPFTDFTGTQVGALEGRDGEAGFLLYDGFGKILRKSDGTFFTTIDVAVAALPNTSQVKFEALINFGRAFEPMDAFSVVYFMDYSEVAPAAGVNLDYVVYGLIRNSVLATEPVNVITQGVVENPLWDFENLGWPINTPLYVGPDSKITNVVQAVGGIFAVVVGKNSIMIRPAVMKTAGESNVERLGDLSDVELEAPLELGQVLTFDGTKWANVDLPVPQLEGQPNTALITTTVGLTAGTVVGYRGSQTIDVLDAAVGAVPDILGLVLRTVSADVETVVVTSGTAKLTVAEWNAVTGGTGLIVGSTYYLGVDGSLSSTPPSEEGEFVIRVGTAISTTDLVVKFSDPISL